MRYADEFEQPVPRQMSKWLRILILTSLAALVFAGIAALGHRSRTGSALQRYKAELVAKGEKLTYAELVGPRSTNASGSLAALTNAVAQLGSSRFHPGSFDFRRYVAPGQACALWMQDTAENRSGWDVGANWEDFAADIAALGTPLDQIREALKEPPADSGPRTSILSGPVSNFIAIRTAAQWLAGVAVCEVRGGCLEEALRDLETLAALARMNREELTLVAQMIRVAVAGLGMSATWEALQAPGWNRTQLERLQKTWEQ